MATILIVDDESDIRDLFAKYLATAGYKTVAANNGWEALLALDNHHIDLILLDVMMPGMDGVTFLKILRNAQSNKNTPVIVVSAMASQDLAGRLRGMKVEGVLPKTQKLFDELLGLVRKTLGNNVRISAN